MTLDLIIFQRNFVAWFVIRTVSRCHQLNNSEKPGVCNRPSRLAWFY